MNKTIYDKYVASQMYTSEKLKVIRDGWLMYNVDSSLYAHPALSVSSMQFLLEKLRYDEMSIGEFNYYLARELCSVGVLTSDALAFFKAVWEKGDSGDFGVAVLDCAQMFNCTPLKLHLIASEGSFGMPYLFVRDDYYLRELALSDIRYLFNKSGYVIQTSLPCIDLDKFVLFRTYVDAVSAYLPDDVITSIDDDDLLEINIWYYSQGLRCVYKDWFDEADLTIAYIAEKDGTRLNEEVLSNIRGCRTKYLLYCVNRDKFDDTPYRDDSFSFDSKVELYKLQKLGVDITDFVKNGNSYVELAGIRRKVQEQTICREVRNDD